MPPSPDSDSGLDDEAVLSDVTFAPKDCVQILLSAKDNTHGLGYRGLDPRKALPSTHINLFDAPRLTKGGSSRKGIRGQVIVVYQQMRARKAQFLHIRLGFLPFSLVLENLILHLGGVR